jgi:hypothetical protein
LKYTVTDERIVIYKEKENVEYVIELPCVMHPEQVKLNVEIFCL